MTLHYLDSSAILKRYLEEIGSDWIVRLCDGNEIAVSTITYAALASGLARRTREESLHQDRRDDILRNYRNDAREMWTIGMRVGIVGDAAKLLCDAPASIALRAFDALQLASARAAVLRATSAGLSPPR